MSEEDDTPRSVRDFRLMARTGFWVVAGVCALIGALVGHVVHEERQDTRIDKLREWQAEKDKDAADEAKRERWRKFRERPPGQPLGPGPERREGPT